ncbi:hypothetical protein [Streptomyces sp. NPDC002851]
MAESGAVDPEMLKAQAIATAMVVAATPKQLRVEGETLSTFKKRVDRLLMQLEKSKAAPKNIANGMLPSGRLGDFDEAQDLHKAYQHVHGQLESLSKMLGLQIEALVTTVDASKAGYQNLDAEVKDQFRRIRTEADAITEKWHRQEAEPRGRGDAGAGAGASEPAPEPTDKEAGGL